MLYYALTFRLYENILFVAKTIILWKIITKCNWMKKQNWELMVNLFLIFFSYLEVVPEAGDDPLESGHTGGSWEEPRGATSEGGEAEKLDLAVLCQLLERTMEELSSWTLDRSRRALFLTRFKYYTYLLPWFWKQQSWTLLQKREAPTKDPSPKTIPPPSCIMAYMQCEIMEEIQGALQVSSLRFSGVQIKLHLMVFKHQLRPQ